MNDILLEVTPQMSAKEKAEFDAMMAEMHRLNEIMRQDQIEIDRLKAETRLYQREVVSQKQEAEKWKMEINALKAETQATLARIVKMMAA